MSNYEKKLQREMNNLLALCRTDSERAMCRVICESEIKKKLIKKRDVMIEKEYRTRDFDALLQRILKMGEEIGYLKKQN